jgi:hypothetical protein
MELPVDVRLAILSSEQRVYVDAIRMTRETDHFVGVLGQKTSELDFEVGEKVADV